MVERRTAPQIPEMQPAMLGTELRLFESFVSCSDRYLEFGSRGSTVWACHMAGVSVTTVESSREWLDKVDTCRAAHGLRIKPLLVLADIGPTRHLGYPADESDRAKWPNYHTSIWEVPGSAEADLHFVDGRFRVARFLQVPLHASGSPLVTIHDFANRPEYGAIHDHAREDRPRRHALGLSGPGGFRPAPGDGRAPGFRLRPALGEPGPPLGAHRRSHADAT